MVSPEFNLKTWELFTELQTRAIRRLASLEVIEVIVKKRIKELTAHLPPVELFLEDIIELFDMVKEFDTAGVLETEEYEFTDARELVDLSKDRLPSLTISYGGSTPYRLHIIIKPEYVYMTIQAIDNDAYGIFHRVRDLLLSKRRYTSWFVRHGTKMWKVGLACMIGGLMGCLPFSPISRHPDYYAISEIVLGIAVLLLMASGLWSKSELSAIWLKKRSEHPTSWQRLDKWVDSKGAINKLVGKALWIIVSALFMLIGAAALYVYQNIGGWLR
jgi:hypothetical protein